MPDRCVEICGISGAQFIFVGANRKLEFSLDDVKKFNTGMLMGTKPLGRDRFKLGIERIEFSLGGLEVQTFKVISDGVPAGIVGEAHALALANDGHDPPLAFVGEKVVQADAENHG